MSLENNSAVVTAEEERDKSITGIPGLPHCAGRYEIIPGRESQLISPGIISL
jgi:hypothetical protein